MRLFSPPVNNMKYQTDDLRIKEIKELLPPEHILREFPIAENAAETVYETRLAIHRILHGADDRLLVIMGPCSIHDVKAGKEYARKLRDAKERLAADLLVVMRVYFEKPRTTIGWKGLINDPHLDGSFSINEGLRIARQLLLDLNQVHRELASGLSCPVGFKNGTDGNVRIALDAIRAAQVPHHFLSVTKAGHSAIVSTTGNEDCHIILRGGKQPNYDGGSVDSAAKSLAEAGIPARIMIDFSHGNSGKDPQMQVQVGRTVAAQISDGDERIFGVMVESHLKGGRQDLAPGKELVYGLSITDACIGWEDSHKILDTLADAVRQRRLKAESENQDD